MTVAKGLSMEVSWQVNESWMGSTLGAPTALSIIDGRNPDMCWLIGTLPPDSTSRVGGYIVWREYAIASRMPGRGNLRRDDTESTFSECAPVASRLRKCAFATTGDFLASRSYAGFPGMPTITDPPRDMCRVSMKIVQVMGVITVGVPLGDKLWAQHAQESPFGMGLFHDN